MTRCRRDRGVTLIELLVAVTLMSIAFGAVLGGLGLAYKVQANQNANSTIDVELRNYAERVRDAAATAYAACPSADQSSYDAVTPPPSDLTPDVSIEFFTGAYGTNGAEFSPTCGAEDHGMQRITVTLTDPRGVRGSLQFGVAAP